VLNDVVEVGPAPFGPETSDVACFSAIWAMTQPRTLADPAFSAPECQKKFKPRGLSRSGDSGRGFRR
jgi:hypothetical protein